MSKILLVLKNEFINTVARRSFLLTLFLLPLATYAIVLIITALQPGGSPNTISRAVLQPDATENIVEGFVDPGGLIQTLPPWISAAEMRSYPNEAAADQALLSGEINAVYLIPTDYLAKGEITIVRQDANPLTDSGQTSAIRDLLNYNLLNDDPQLTQRMSEPMVLTRRSLSPEAQRDPDSMLTFFVPYGVTMLFYIVIIGSSSLMLNSITTEKQNRVMEMLITSITPIQMLTGKIIALGLAGLLQTLVWSGIGYFLLQFSGSSFSLPAAFQLPMEILLWGVLFFILGYLLYASLMAGVGALVPSLREASQVTTIIILPLILPLMLISVIIRNPNGLLAVILSLFPLTAPVTIMMRLAATTVPMWQIALSALLLLASSILLVRSVAGLFRAQNLLSGQSFHLKRFLKALVNRA